MTDYSKLSDNQLLDKLNVAEVWFALCPLGQSEEDAQKYIKAMNRFNALKKEIKQRGLKEIE